MGTFGYTLAASLAPNINVNAICPSNIETDMETSYTPETKKMMIDETPLKRFGTPDEIADAALFLPSPNQTSLPAKY